MSSDAPADRELIESFLAGSEDSFEELIHRYETKVFNLAMRLTRNQEDAEEILQDVFVTLYRKLFAFEGKSAFSSWLYRITANASFMKLRKRKSQRSVFIDDLYPHIREGLHFGWNCLGETDSLLRRKELRAALERAVNRLPDDYRAVFLLRDVDGLSNSETSEILGLTIPAVKSRLHRSRIILRNRLKRVYDSVRDDKQIFAIPLPQRRTWSSV